MNTPTTPTLTFAATLALLPAAAIVGWSAPALAFEPPAASAEDHEWLQEDEGCGCAEEFAPLELLVAEGETLSHYAAWSGIPADVIAEESGLTPDAPLLPGQLVLLYVDVETEETVLRRKAALSAARQARFLTERPIVTTLRHEVRAGETAWKLARGAGVPLWLLGHLNPGVELDRLRAGTTLTIPVLDELQAVLLDDADEEPGC